MLSEITDFHELLQEYEWVFGEEVRGDHLAIWRVAGILVERGELEDIKIPSVESCLEGQFRGPIICRKDSKDPNDLCAIVGISYATWKSYVNGCLKGAKKDGLSFSKPKEFQDLRPKPLEGGSHYGGPFDLHDVLRLRLHRDMQVVDHKSERPLTRHLFLPKSLLPLKNPDPFVPLLRAKIREVLAELEENNDAIFEHPDHLPRSNTEVVQAYRSLVIGVVRRRLKFGLPFEDAVSEVWLKLVGSDIIRKFINTATRKFPPTITVDEAVDFLGVSWGAWCEMVDNHPTAPSPIKGSNKDPEGLLDSETVLALDREGYFKQRHNLRRLPPSSVTLARFENYLRTAADNHMKNVLRTQDRRFNKEVTQGAVVLTQTGDIFKRSIAVDENTAWETTLRDEDPLVEEVLDGHFIARALLAQKLGVVFKSPEYFVKLDECIHELRATNAKANVDDVLQKYGLSYGSPEYYAEVSQLAKSVGDFGPVNPEHGLCLIKLISEGYTYEEAVQKQREYELQQTGEVSLVQVAM